MGLTSEMTLSNRERETSIKSELEASREAERILLQGFELLVTQPSKENKNQSPWIVNDYHGESLWRVSRIQVEAENCITTDAWSCELLKMPKRIPIPAGELDRKKDGTERKEPQVLCAITFYPHTKGFSILQPQKAGNGNFARAEINYPVKGNKSLTVSWDEEAGLLVNQRTKLSFTERRQELMDCLEKIAANKWGTGKEPKQKKYAAGIAVALLVLSVACGFAPSPSGSQPVAAAETLPPASTATPSLIEAAPLTEPVEIPLGVQSKELPEYLPEIVRQKGVRAYEGREKEIIEEVEEVYGIKMISPNYYLRGDGTEFANLPYTEDELRILKEGLEIIPIQLRKLLWDREIVMIKAPHTTGGPGGLARVSSPNFGNQNHILFYLPANFDSRGSTRAPFNSNERRMKAALLHEFVHVYTLTDPDGEIHKKWAENMGWMVNEDGSWNYDRETGGWNYYFNKNAQGFLLGPQEDIAFSIQLYCLEPDSLDASRIQLIEEIFGNRGITFSRIP